jgi:MFS family permease
VSEPLRVPALAPFRVRAFRFQWPADLATSWAFEMETLILGWYVLVETQSVFMLTVFASLQYIGTLLAPMFGVMGDRVGHRNLLCAMRGLYASCAMTLMTFALLGMVTPTIVLVIAGIMGLVRPSDIGVRSALVADTMPSDRMVGAMSIQRTTQDSARVAGALTGAGLVALLGMGPAYVVVASFYVTSIVLTWKAGGVRTAQPSGHGADDSDRPSPWRELKEGLAYVWHTPHLKGAMCHAFLLNMTAFPLFNGLLPYVAKEVYFSDQTTLGYMVAAASFGALTGALIMSRIAHSIRPARVALMFGAGWYLMLVVFAHTPHAAIGIPILIFTGIIQSTGLIPMTAMLLRNSDTRYRGRVMGIRMLMLYGNLPGLLLAGPLIASLGYSLAATLYCAIGLAFTLAIAVNWRDHLWRRDAPANTK